MPELPLIWLSLMLLNASTFFWIFRVRNPRTKREADFMDSQPREMLEIPAA